MLFLVLGIGNLVVLQTTLETDVEMGTCWPGESANVVINFYGWINRYIWLDAVRLAKFLPSVVVGEISAIFCFPHIDLHGLPWQVNDYQFKPKSYWCHSNCTDSVNFAILNLQDAIYNFSNEITLLTSRPTAPSHWTARDLTSYTTLITSTSYSKRTTHFFLLLKRMSLFKYACNLNPCTNRMPSCETLETNSRLPVTQGTPSCQSH